MNIEDIVQLLNNRLREFQLSRDYAKMSGNLERVNAADAEILALEDTLFKLKLLLDTSKSAAVTESVLTEVITDGSVAVLGEYDITPYATDPLHEEKIMNILSKMGVMDTVEKIDGYIKAKYLSSPVTGGMVMNAAEAYTVDARLIMAIMEQDSSFGTAGKAVRTLNPGNVGNNDAGDTVTYESWQEGVTAVARWLSRHRVSQQIEETIVVPTATSTPTTAATSTPETVAPAPEILPVITSTTTTTTATSTPTTSATSTPATLPNTEENLPVSTSTTTSATATSTPMTAPTAQVTLPVSVSATTTQETAAAPAN